MKKGKKVWLTALVAAALAVLDTLAGAGAIPEAVAVILDAVSLDVEPEPLPEHQM